MALPEEALIIINFFLTFPLFEPVKQFVKKILLEQHHTTLGFIYGRIGIVLADLGTFSFKLIIKEIKEVAQL